MAVQRGIRAHPDEQDARRKGIGCRNVPPPQDTEATEQKDDADQNGGGGI